MAFFYWAVLVYVTWQHVKAYRISVTKYHGALNRLILVTYLISAGFCIRQIIVA